MSFVVPAFAIASLLVSISAMVCGYEVVRAVRYGERWDSRYWSCYAVVGGSAWSLTYVIYLSSIGLI